MELISGALKDGMDLLVNYLVGFAILSVKAALDQALKNA